MTVAARRTQAERSAATRALIIRATVDSLVELGHAGTTTLEVQRRAGVSRGALLHHFRSRAELLVAAVDELFAAQREAFYAAPKRRGIDEGIDALWRTFNSPLAVAADELWSAARNDAELREALARQNRALRDQVRDMAAEQWTDLVKHPNYEMVLLVVVDAMRGAARARVVRSDRATATRIAAWKRLTHLLLDDATSKRDGSAVGGR
ncbi:MAG TPA: helix-turn-helix domain-containing protein [Mycobacteriales bacterium]|nr:helix-turn-helix domain-containing protein [Mycobacteriales bacterium]